MNLFIRILALLALSAPVVTLANTEPTEPTQTLAPYFYLPGAESSGEAFPLKTTEVDVQIAGVIAEVVVTQTYANMGNDAIEAVYVFPASTRAAVHGMTMQIGERRIEAVVQERQQAKETFETAKAEGKTTTLLEQQRPNVFEMRVANILPGDEVKVELRYSEHLVPEDQLYEFVFPTVVGPRYSNTPVGAASDTERWVANPYLEPGTPDPARFQLNLTLKAGMPIAEAVSPSHATDILFSAKDVVALSLKPDEEPANNRDFLFRYRLADQAIASGLLLHKGGAEEDDYFLLTVEPPARVRPETVPAREYCFIVDVSGSMSGFPLDTAKTLVRELIGQLNSRDRFNIMFFAGSARRMAAEPVPATRSNIKRALNMLDQQRGGGGTELGKALEQYYKNLGEDPVSRSVVVVTDGFVSFETAVFDLIREKLGESNLFAFGIGSSVNRFLIEGMARAGQGEPFVVTRPNESKVLAKRFADYVSAPLLTNVEVTFDGFDTYDLEPEALPDLLADRPLVLSGKWKGSATGTIRVSGVTGEEPFEKTFHVDEAGMSSKNPALRLLWARNRIASLGDYASIDNNQETIQAITNLGLTHNLLTAYTSFVAVDNEARKVAENREVKQPLPLPKGVSASAVGGVKTTPEPGAVGLFFIVVLFFLIQMRRGTSRRTLA